MKNDDAKQDDQVRRFLMVNDDPLVCKLIGRMLDFHFTCEYDAVGRGEMAVQRLLEEKYDLILLDSKYPEMTYAKLPADIAAVYRAIPKERGGLGDVKFWTEGERLFRLLRSPEVADLGWATDVGSVPVIFLTGGPRNLNRAMISTMPPVAILPLPTDMQDLINTVKDLLGETESED